MHPSAGQVEQVTARCRPWSEPANWATRWWRMARCSLLQRGQENRCHNNEEDQHPTQQVANAAQVVTDDKCGRRIAPVPGEFFDNRIVGDFLRPARRAPGNPFYTPPTVGIARPQRNIFSGCLRPFPGSLERNSPREARFTLLLDSTEQASWRSCYSNGGEWDRP